MFQVRDCAYVFSEYHRSFDYYNHSRRLATAFSFRKWFPPDGSRQSERISTWFPRTVRARTFAFRATAVHSAFAVARSLKRNAERKFREKNEYVDKSKFRRREVIGHFFLRHFFAIAARIVLRAEKVRFRECKPPSISSCQCEASYFVGAEKPCVD